MLNLLKKWWKWLVALVIPTTFAATMLVGLPAEQSPRMKAPPFATSTPEIPAFRILTFDGEIESQGACLKIRDADGVGFTYLTTQSGAGVFTKTSCE